MIVQATVMVKGDQALINREISDLFAFIEESPTAFHAVESVRRRLLHAGFTELLEGGEWDLQPCGRYFVKRNGSSLISFILPDGEVRGFHMAASHTDSPAFKIKSCPEIRAENIYVKLNTEKYGGMILSTWLDRPLSIAGRVFCEGEDGRICSRLINFDRDLLVIPNLAIHMNPELNKGFSYNPQVDMLPVFSDKIESTLRGLIAKEFSLPNDKILSEELFVYVRQGGCVIGEKGQWILAPRLDDLQCVYASMEGMLLAEPKEYLALSAFFDNEEVGSSTRQGADSTFLDDVIQRICAAISLTGTEQKHLLSRSFLISADNAHALHPNHPEKADITNRPVLNGGIVIKQHGSQKYTTDGYSHAVLVKLCKEAGVEYQTYCNRSDILGGSTLGNISAAHVSVPAADIGFAQLAMHSAVETAGREDVWQGVRLFQTYWSK